MTMIIKTMKAHTDVHSYLENLFQHHHEIDFVVLERSYHQLHGDDDDGNEHRA